MRLTTGHNERSGWICVKDNGVGIPADQHEAVFDEFRRVPSAYTSTQQGTGLGLALVKRFMTLMGGEVRIESEVGKGSAFTVSLPLGQAPAMRDGGKARVTTGSSKAIPADRG